MFALLRSTSLRAARPRGLVSVHHAPPLSSVRSASTSADIEDDAIVEDVEADVEEEGTVRNLRYEDWLMEEGYRYRDPKPRNWLGGEVPFPLNPSFKPPIPLSDTLRTLIYRQYMADPKTNSVRALATQYHLSIKRVDAILRLKGLEAHWAKNQPLQTGFVKGMEDVLGVTHHMRTRVSKSLTSEDPTRHDIQEADAHDEQEGSDWARLRYQRMFWESIPEGEGKEPLMPDILEKAREDMQKQIKATRDAKSHPTLVPRFQGKDHDKIKFVKPEGRPAIKFVDVGGKFLDVNDRKRRIAESERRSKVKARRKEAAYASRTTS